MPDSNKPDIGLNQYTEKGHAHLPVVGYSVPMSVVGDNVRKFREAKGWSQDELAELAGTTQSTIDRLEGGKVQNSRYLPRIVGALGVALSDVDPSYAPVPRGTPLPRPNALSAERDFPIYASVEGGQGEIIRSADPVDWIRRPEQVASVKDAYGFYVVGESMVPELEPGDIALVNPALPLVSNTTCVFYNEDIGGDVRAIIKRLLRSDSVYWHLRQHNPARGRKRDFAVRREEWPVCHRVLGKYYRQ